MKYQKIINLNFLGNTTNNLSKKKKKTRLKYWMIEMQYNVQIRKIFQ